MDFHTRSDLIKRYIPIAITRFNEAPGKHKRLISEGIRTSVSRLSNGFSAADIKNVTGIAADSAPHI